MSEFKRGNFSLIGYQPPFMKLGDIQVTPEEIEMVCENLEEWVSQPSSLITAQFFKEYKIGYTYFQYIKYISPKLHFVWEVVLSTLCARWFKKGIHGESSYSERVVNKYLRLYDLYQLEVETQKAMDIKREEVEAKIQSSLEIRQTENYANHKLDEKYQASYDSNVRKRKKKKKSK